MTCQLEYIFQRNALFKVLKKKKNRLPAHSHTYIHYMEAASLNLSLKHLFNGIRRCVQHTYRYKTNTSVKIKPSYVVIEPNPLSVCCFTWAVKQKHILAHFQHKTLLSFQIPIVVSVETQEFNIIPPAELETLCLPPDVTAGPGTSRRCCLG